MTELAVRDDRASEERLAEYERAVKEAAAIQEEVAALEAATATPEQAEATGKKQKSEKLTKKPATAEKPSAEDEPLSSPEGGQETAAMDGTQVVNRVIGTVAEAWPWPWPFDPPPPPKLTRSQGADFIDGPNGNGYIATDANLFDSGELQATSHAWAVNWFGGLTFGVLIVIADESNNIIARSGLQQIGVDGTLVPFKESNRFVTFTENFGTEVAARGQAIYIAHFHAGKNRLPEILNEIFNTVKSVADFVGSFCTQNPEICATVAKAFI